MPAVDIYKNHPDPCLIKPMLAAITHSSNPPEKRATDLTPVSVQQSNPTIIDDNYLQRLAMP